MSSIESEDPHVSPASDTDVVLHGNGEQDVGIGENPLQTDALQVMDHDPLYNLDHEPSSIFDEYDYQSPRNTELQFRIGEMIDDLPGNSGYVEHLLTPPANSPRGIVGENERIGTVSGGHHCEIPVGGSKLSLYQDLSFESMVNLEKFVRTIAVSEGFNFLVGSSVYWEGKKEYRHLQLLCFMHNAPKAPDDPQRTACRGSCCPFKLTAKYNSATGTYSFRVAGVHNHLAIHEPEILASAERLPDAAKQTAIEFFKQGLTIAEIYEKLCSEFKEHRIAKSTVSNYLHGYSRAWLGDLSPATKLLFYMTERGYIVHHVLGEDNEMQKLLFLSPEQKRMLSWYGHVLIMDCT